MVLRGNPRREDVWYHRRAYKASRRSGPVRSSPVPPVITGADEREAENDYYVGFSARLINNVCKAGSRSKAAVKDKVINTRTICPYVAYIQ